MSRYARKTDDNQRAIVEALRKLGVWVWPTHALGGGFPDLLVWTRAKGFMLLEVKDGAKTESKRRLTPAEGSFLARCPGPVHVVSSLDEAIAVICGISQ